MSLRLPVAALGAAAISACTATTVPSTAAAEVGAARPLDTLPAGFDRALVRQDLLATGAERFGAAALSEARKAPAHLIVKRFVGMAPPPPPGAGPDWRPASPAALLMRRAGGWMVATPTGWRPTGAAAAAELDALLADAGFWKEPAYIPPCPDFGASLLLLKVPDRAETVRNSTCNSRASQVVEAALNA